MKKLSITTFLCLILFSCSNEQASVQEGTCFSNGTTTYKWTMVTTWPKNFPGLGLAPENFSKYVEENSILIVLPKKNIIIAKKNLDITNIIMDLLNNELKKIDF